MKLKLSIIFITVLFFGCKSSKNSTSHDGESGATKIVNTLHYPQEKHLPD